ncbi:MAG: porin [Planctomycetaceae bacterium]|jgi:hypothetical protein|nr:porin [Planctomycetaceae bacterium]
MKKRLLGGLGVVVAVVAMQFVQTDTQASLFERLKPCAEVGECNPCEEVAATCDPCGEVDACNTKRKSKWFVNGYIETGFFANEYGQKTHYTSNRQYRDYSYDPLSGNTDYLQNVNKTGGQLNQLYISTGRSVDGRHGLDIGGTVDFTFGTDARFVQSAGFEYQGTPAAKEWQWGTGDYYSAFAQAYFEIAYKKWNVKVGKVYAPFGSNSYKSTDRFFYSLADTYGMVPATALAAYATYNVSNNFSVYAGWAQPDQFGETSDDNAFLFGFDWAVGKKLTLSYALGKGTNDRYKSLPGGAEVDYFVQSLVAKYKVSKKLTSIFDWSLLNNNYKGAGYSFVDGIYGINTELIYQYNSRWAFGFRAGWGRDINGYLYQNVVNDHDNKYTFSLGANWTPRKWLTIKTELRYDKFEDSKDFNTTGDNGVTRPGAEWKNDQLAGGVSAIVKF